MEKAVTIGFGKTLLLVMLIAFSATLAASPLPAAATQPVFKGWASETENPTTPGYHKLVYTWKERDEVRQMPFVLYLPEGYTPDKHWPLLVFLAGMGERGSDPAVVMNCGIPVDLGSAPEVRKWLPMIMLFPLCPGDRTWDSPDMPPIVVRFIRESLNRWPVDANRVYVTGLSMGGRGCWAVAREAPDLFAVAAPLVGREFEPQITAKKLASSMTTFLAISGLTDPVSEPDTRHMVDALRQYPLDVVYAPVPHASHGLWPRYYSSKEFYQWLLLHEKGKPIPPTRASADEMVALYFSNEKGSQQFQEKLQQDFGKFAQYWFLDNCAPREGLVGMKPEVAGRKNVFVTYPLTPEVGCRLQITQMIPVHKSTWLKLDAGRHPEGDWELVIRVDELEVIRRMVDKQTAPDGWLHVQFDLTPWASSEVRIQVIHQATGWTHEEGYWSQVALESK